MKATDIPTRYWIGYLRVSYLKYKIVLLFTSKILNWLIPTMFYKTKLKEAEIFGDKNKKYVVRELRKSNEVRDLILSREFLMITPPAYR